MMEYTKPHAVFSEKFIYLVREPRIVPELEGEFLLAGKNLQEVPEQRSIAVKTRRKLEKNWPQLVS